MAVGTRAELLDIAAAQSSTTAARSFEFRVEEFLPERLKLELESPRERLAPGETLPLEVEADYLYGAPAAGNRTGRHGLWQRPVERRRLRDASLLVPWSEGGLAEAPEPHADAVVVPVPVEPSGAAAERDIAAITYGAHPEKKGLDRVLAAWAAAHRDGEELVVAGLDEARGRAFASRARTARTATRSARPQPRRRPLR